MFNKSKKSQNNSYLTVSILGKSYKLNINYFNYNNVKIIKKVNEICLYLPMKYKHIDNVDIINDSIKNLYKQIAQKEIENAMELARHIVNFAPQDYLIKNLSNCFYKSNKNLIVISPDIMRYNREIINTTIIQAFCKAKYRSNSSNYKKLIQESMEKYETIFSKEFNKSNAS